MEMQPPKNCSNSVLKLQRSPNSCFKPAERIRPEVSLPKLPTKPKCIFNGLKNAFGPGFNKSGVRCRPYTRKCSPSTNCSIQCRSSAKPNCIFQGLLNALGLVLALLLNAIPTPEHALNYLIQQLGAKPNAFFEAC